MAILINPHILILKIAVIVGLIIILIIYPFYFYQKNEAKSYLSNNYKINGLNCNQSDSAYLQLPSCINSGYVSFNRFALGIGAKYSIYEASGIGCGITLSGNIVSLLSFHIVFGQKSIKNLCD